VLVAFPRLPAGCWIGQSKLAAVLAEPTHGAGLARWRGQPHHRVAVQQVRRQPGQPGHQADVEDECSPDTGPHTAIDKATACTLVGVTYASPGCPGQL